MKNDLLKMGAGKSSEIRGALGDASSGSLSTCPFVPPFTLLPADHPAHPPIYSSSLLLALLDSLSLLLSSRCSCVASSLSMSPPRPHGCCKLINSVLLCHQFVVALISFIFLVSAVNSVFPCCRVFTDHFLCHVSIACVSFSKGLFVHRTGFGLNGRMVGPRTMTSLI